MRNHQRRPFWQIAVVRTLVVLAAVLFLGFITWAGETHPMTALCVLAVALVVAYIYNDRRE